MLAVAWVVGLCMQLKGNRGVVLSGLGTLVDWFFDMSRRSNNWVLRVVLPYNKQRIYHLSYNI